MSAVMQTIISEPPAPVTASATAAMAGSDAAKPAVAVRSKPRAAKSRWPGLVMRVVPPLAGLAFLVLIWQIIAVKNGSFPTPLVTLQEAIKLFSDPFYRTGPNDQGIGWNVLASLQRVAIGFGLAAVVGIPLGFMIGRIPFLAGMFGPIISTAMSFF